MKARDFLNTSDMFNPANSATQQIMDECQKLGSGKIGFLGVGLWEDINLLAVRLKEHQRGDWFFVVNNGFITGAVQTSIVYSSLRGGRFFYSTVGFFDTPQQALNSFLKLPECRCNVVQKLAFTI